MSPWESGPQLPPIATAGLKLDEQVIVSLFLRSNYWFIDVVNNMSELPWFAVSLTDSQNGIRPRATNKMKLNETRN